MAMVGTVGTFLSDPPSASGRMPRSRGLARILTDDIYGRFFIFVSYS
jgi:hypothetical protein